MKRLTPIFLVLSLLLCSCGNNQAPDAQQEQLPQSTPASTNPVLTPEDYFSNRDFDSSYDAQSTWITLEADTATCSGSGVTIDGSTVTITAEGTYILAGALEDGQILVNVQKDEKVQLVLEGVSVCSSTGAALYVQQADKVFVTTAEGTENTFTNGGSFETADGENVDGAVYSKEDITFNGQGKLTVISPAGHGIVSKDSLAVTSGIYEISAASHGLSGKDDVAVADGSLTITAGKDGIHAENNDDATLGTVYLGDGIFQITAEGDGISGAAAVQIDGGAFTILAGGGSENGTSASSDNWGQMGGRPGGMGGKPGGMGDRPGSNPNEQEDTTDSTSMKGIKAGTELMITAGTFQIDSADDGLHSNGSVTLTGGSFTVATGDDGFHAEENLTITAGTILITESYEGLEGLHIAVSGGEITLVSSDDGLNAAGGTDQSGTTGGRDGMFGGGRGGRPGGGFGGMSGNSDGSIKISGGNLLIHSSGDGIDANGSLEISGGYTVVVGPTQGDTATLDYDTSAVITGGTFIGTGAAGMAQTFSDSEQGVIAVQVGSQGTGTQIILQDKNGNTVLSHTPELSFAVVILSCPEMVKGETYTITVGTQSGSFAAS